MNIKEMLDNIPKTNNLVSAYGSINIDDLQKAMNRFKKAPTYDELLKENNKQKEVLDKIRKNNARIIDYGFDYDGFNKEEDLKKLIDMLVDYASKNNELLEEIE